MGEEKKMDSEIRDAESRPSGGLSVVAVGAAAAGAHVMSCWTKPKLKAVLQNQVYVRSVCPSDPVWRCLRWSQSQSRLGTLTDQQIWFGLQREVICPPPSLACPARVLKVGRWFVPK
jgi:hypothetical protein